MGMLAYPHHKVCRGARSVDGDVHSDSFMDSVHHFMPEYCLPFTIHLLAHDPSFDESRIQRPTQQLAFMISGLVRCYHVAERWVVVIT